MIAERTKLLSQERRKAAVAAANMQSLNRLTNRKSSLQKTYLVNEYNSADKGTAAEKVVNYNNSKTTNHKSSIEGKK